MNTVKTATPNTPLRQRMLEDMKMCGPPATMFMANNLNCDESSP